MKEEQGHLVERAVHDRRERADLRDMRSAELGQRPLAYFELTVGHRLRRLGRYLEQERIRVAEHRLAAESRETVECLRRFRPALRDIAEADDLLDSKPFDVVERGAEGDVVPVLIREKCETHGQSLLLMPSRPVRTHSG